MIVGRHMRHPPRPTPRQTRSVLDCVQPPGAFRKHPTNSRRRHSSQLRPPPEQPAPPRGAPAARRLRSAARRPEPTTHILFPAPCSPSSYPMQRGNHGATLILGRHPLPAGRFGHPPRNREAPATSAPCKPPRLHPSPVAARRLTVARHFNALSLPTSFKPPHKTFFDGLPHPRDDATFIAGARTSRSVLDCAQSSGAFPNCARTVTVHRR